MATKILIDIEKHLDDGNMLSTKMELPIDSTWTVIFGPSGAGKSTLLRTIAGLDRPTKGLIKFGEVTWEDTANQIFVSPQKRSVGLLFQDFALFPHMTVESNITYNLSLPKKEKRERLQEFVKLFGIEGLEKRKPYSLSGGEKQKVAIARTTIRRPQLLLLDEPLSSLDLPTREGLQRELKKVLKKLKIPTIFVTHDRTEAIIMGDRVAVMNDGEIVQMGEVNEVFTKPDNPSVAAIVGTENVLIGKIINRAGSLIDIKVGKKTLVALDNGVPGPQVAACIRAEEIILEKGVVPESSARNRFVGKVMDILLQGATARLTLDCGFPLVVLITKRSLMDLSIQIGAELTSSIKAQAIHVFQHD